MASEAGLNPASTATRVAVDAGFNPASDAIFLEPVDDHARPYVNIIVARKEDENNKTYQKIVDAYQTEDTVKVMHGHPLVLRRWHQKQD